MPTDMARDAALARIARRQAGVFTRSQALSAGFTNEAVLHRLRSGRWRPLVRGVYVASLTAPTPAQRLWVAVLSAGPGAVLSHATASTIWRLDGPRRDERVHVTVPRRRLPSPRAGSVVHRSVHLGSADVARWQELPVTTPARTLVDVATGLTVPALRRAVVDATRRGLVTPDRLAVVAERLAGVPGAAAVRRVLATLDPKLESVLEAELLALIRAAGAPTGSAICTGTTR